MPDPLPPVPGPEPPWTGLIKTRNDKVVNEKVPFVAGLTLMKDFKFTKKDNATSDAERRKFKSSICGNWLKGLAGNAEKVAHLKAAGLTDADVKRMAEGLRPIGYEVHHKLALDDGGTNDPSNFVIIRNDPYHIAITALHNSKCRDIPEGTTVTVDWPVPDGIVYPPPPPAPPA